MGINVIIPRSVSDNISDKFLADIRLALRGSGSATFLIDSTSHALQNSQKNDSYVIYNYSDAEKNILDVSDGFKNQQDIVEAAFTMQESTNSKRYIYDSLFEDCKSLKKVILKGAPFQLASIFKNCQSLEEVDFSDTDLSVGNFGSNAFENCINLKSVDFSNKTFGSMKMNYAFHNCYNLKKMSFKNVRTDRGVVFNWTFLNCCSLEEINFDGAVLVINDALRRTFDGCNSLKTIDVSGWDVSNIIAVNRVFMCEELEEIIGIENWNLSNVIDISIFMRCPNLRSIDFSSISIGEKCRNIYSLISGDSSDSYNSDRNNSYITSIDMSGVSAPNCTIFSGVVSYLNALQRVDLRNLDMRNATNYINFFVGLPALNEVVANDNCGAKLVESLNANACGGSTNWSYNSTTKIISHN
jgi:surface protein